MQNLRKYGPSPYHVAVVHGGPGAPGSVAPIARILSAEYGILEPFQTADSLDGQVKELKNILDQHADLPAILIGWSWGAWLSFILAARHPDLVRKLILVSSGPFEASYAARIMPTRLARLTPEERAEVDSLLHKLADPSAPNRDAALSRFGGLLKARTDTYDALTLEVESVDLGLQADIYQRVWDEADKLRKSGDLLDLAGHICCPVATIHGDYDPHPADGVRDPLSVRLKDFRFHLLEKCGHYPWLEKEAQSRFFDVLRQELR